MSKYVDYSFAEAAAAIELTEEEVQRLCPDMAEDRVDLGIAVERYHQVYIRMLITNGGREEFLNPFIWSFSPEKGFSRIKYITGYDPDFKEKENRAFAALIKAWTK
jgi:hypothetical protein